MKTTSIVLLLILTLLILSIPNVHASSQIHTPIVIIGNENFTIQNGVISGSGTLADPYIISGWEISTNGYAITIRNTTKYFVIENINYPAYGIYLDNISNGKIYSINHNNLTYVDVRINNSQNVDIVSSTFKGSYGVKVENSTDIKFFGDTFNFNIYSGIYIYNSTDVRIEHSQINSDEIGIMVGESDEVDINSTLISYSSSINIFAYSDSNLSIERVGTLYSESDGIYLQDVYRYSITNSTISSNKKDGVYCLNSSYGDIEHNNINYNGEDGINIEQGYSNLITYNIFNKNHRYGVRFGVLTAYNYVYLNRFTYNHGSTSAYQNGKSQGFDASTLNHWNTTIPAGKSHGYGNYWSDWTSPDNNNDGIVDYPYPIDGGLNKDYFPLTEVKQKNNYSYIYIILIGFIVFTFAYAIVSFLRKR